MQAEFAQSLRPLLDIHGSDLQIQDTFMPEKEIHKRYLNRPYGHAYDFDQIDRMEFFDQQSRRSEIHLLVYEYWHRR